MEEYKWSEILIGLIIIVIFLTCIYFLDVRCCKKWADDHPDVYVEGCKYFDQETNEWKSLARYDQSRYGRPFHFLFIK